jgi:hypothetical protein
MNFQIFQIPSVYTIWDGLSLKTISRYCPFKLFCLSGGNVFWMQTYFKTRQNPDRLLKSFFSKSLKADKLKK